MSIPQLYMLLLGCRPPGRYTEQHDIFFDIGANLEQLLPAVKESWPEANGIMHIDAWRKITCINGYEVVVKEKQATEGNKCNTKLFFINLGGYKAGEFDEFHYKMVIAAADKGEAIKLAKQSAFYKHTGYKGAASHIDDKYGIDVDDIHAIEDILPAATRARYAIELTYTGNTHEDEMHLGYLKLTKVKKGDYTTE